MDHGRYGHASRTTRILKVLAWAPLAALLALWFVQLPDFGRLQYNDYYGLLPQLADNAGHYSRNPLSYLRLKSNEHTVAIPAALYVVNAKLTHGDNRGLSAVSLLFMVVGFSLLYMWTPERWRRQPVAKTIVIAVLAAFALTPVAAHNVVKGFSGTIWLLANALALGAMTVLARLKRHSRPLELWPILALGVLGALSYSTTLSLWPALLIGAVLLGLDGRKLTVLAVAGLVVTAIYLSTVDTPSHHPGADAGHPADLLRYLAIYVGNVIAGTTSTAMTAGLVGLALFAASVIWTASSAHGFRRQSAPWVMLGVYGLGNGIGTAITRTGFGSEQALASRYATLSAFLWLALIGIAALKAADIGPTSARRRSLTAVAVIALVLAGVSLSHGIGRLREHVRAAAHQPAAELAIQYGIWDDVALHWITPDPGGPIRAIPFLRQNRHVPFDRPIESSLGQRLPPSGLARGRRQDLIGARDRVTPLSEQVSRVEGWVFCPGATVRRLLVVDDAGIVRGEARISVFREDVSVMQGPVAGWGGFLGWVTTPDPTMEMRMVVQFTDDGYFYPFGKTFRLGG